MKRVLITALIFAASAAQGEIYRWVDSRGTTHYTNSMDEIPVRYRAGAKPLSYETGKKADAAMPQQSGQGPVVNPGGQPAVQPAGGGQTRQVVPSAENEMPLQRGQRSREFRKSRRHMPRGE